jgi:hypothetical protein
MDGNIALENYRKRQTDLRSGQNMKVPIDKIAMYSTNLVLRLIADRKDYGVKLKQKRPGSLLILLFKYSTRLMFGVCNMLIRT